MKRIDDMDRQNGRRRIGQDPSPEPAVIRRTVQARPVKVRTVRSRPERTEVLRREPESAPRKIRSEEARRPVSYGKYRGSLIAKEPFREPPLTYRHELKYYINYRDYIVLRQCLKGLMKPDKHSGPTGDYHIRSLYFDDMDESALLDKLAGTKDRGKYRIRIYGLSSKVIRFEKKIKEGQYIGKKSFALTQEEYYQLMNGHPNFLLSKREPLAKEVWLKIVNGRLSPRVVVDYEREAYVMDYESVRITFDKQIKSGGPGDIFDKHLPVVPISEKGVTVLEVKFNKALPDYIRNVLGNMDAPQRSSISKYVLCRKYD